MQEELIVFTRHPEPGKAKTRLIPALGAEGAAELHRKMTEHTIAQAKSLKNSRSTTIAVHFTGGTVTQMQNWLGSELRYYPQQSGDLGDRLINAFQTAFNSGATSAIAIGTDCPELSTEQLAIAFTKLISHPLVIGSASDGGYYLIGLQTLIPELFQTISWSTNIVFSQTLEIAKKLQLEPFHLPTLNDIDRPEDLQKIAHFL